MSGYQFPTYSAAPMAQTFQPGVYYAPQQHLQPQHQQQPQQLQAHINAGSVQPQYQQAATTHYYGSPQPIQFANSNHPSPVPASGYSPTPSNSIHPSSPSYAQSTGYVGASSPSMPQPSATPGATPITGYENIPVPQPVGRKKALLIGINYFGQRGQLRGCINDVRNMSTYLVQQFGYKREDMVILTDDQHNPVGHPTKHNILRAMHWLSMDAKPQDSLFFHYSGHGGQTRNPEVDDQEGYDEVIYPVDFRTTGHISDDEMHRILVQPLQQGVRLTAIFDSCHSGTALDLPYMYSTQGLMKVPDSALAAGQELIQCMTDRATQSKNSGSRSISSSAQSFVKRLASGSRGTNFEKGSLADVVMFSSSKDNQKSADISVSSQPTGAMSWAFISALSKNPQQSYVQLLNNIRDELGNEYTQRPQLSSSHPLKHASSISLMTRWSRITLLHLVGTSFLLFLLYLYFSVYHI